MGNFVCSVVSESHTAAPASRRAKFSRDLSGRHLLRGC